MHPTMVYTTHDDTVEVKDSSLDVMGVAQAGVSPVTADGRPANDTGLVTSEQASVISAEIQRVQDKLSANTYHPTTGAATPRYTGAERATMERELAQLQQSLAYQNFVNGQVDASRAAAQDYRTQQLTQELQRQELAQGLSPEEQDVVEEIARGIMQARTRRLQNR